MLMLFRLVLLRGRVWPLSPGRRAEDDFAGTAGAAGKGSDGGGCPSIFLLLLLPLLPDDDSTCRSTRPSACRTTRSVTVSRRPLTIRVVVDTDTDEPPPPRPPDDEEDVLVMKL